MEKSNLDFDELRKYRNQARSRLQMHVSTLAFYRTKKPGFVHLFEQTCGDGAAAVKDEPSSASTATCVESLIASGEDLKAGAGDPAQLLEWLMSDVNAGSAGLPEKNPFTTAFMLDAALQVSDAAHIDLSSTQKELKEAAVERLNRVLLHDQVDGALAEQFGGPPEDKDGKQPASRAEKGSANIEPYPPTAYLTQLVVRTLLRAKALQKEARDAVRVWSRAHIEREIALLVSADQLADAYALAYAAITFASLVDESNLTPQEKRLLSASVERVFAAQNPDGSWPRSRPLFHYKKVGNAYCFEYEMLTQLLNCRPLRDDVERHISGLLKAITHLDETRYDLSDSYGRRGAAWASGHHPQIRGPESWSTASVYHFLHLMERFLSRMLRRELFRRLKADPEPLVLPPATLDAPNTSVTPTGLEATTAMQEPTAQAAVPEERTPLERFAEKMLDSRLYEATDKYASFKEQVRAKFLKPLYENRHRVERGKQFRDADGRKIQMSMLMFGPPGTSKTSLAEEIARVLEWPLLKVDPSHILIDGWDRVHATAIHLLDELAELDEVVVLLDEFDELVRTRGSEREDPISRFFTTAMLPKLIKLNEERRIILLMATNHVEKFDDAIMRRGRFDKVVQVMPPTAAAKLTKWPILNRYFPGSTHHEALEDLSYDEAESLAEKVADAKDEDDALAMLHSSHTNCNLLRPATADNKTWKSVCKDQETKVRI